MGVLRTPGEPCLETARAGTQTSRAWGSRGELHCPWSPPRPCWLTLSSRNELVLLIVELVGPCFAQQCIPNAVAFC